MIEVERLAVRQFLPIWGQLPPEMQKLIEESVVSKTFLPGEFVHRGAEDCSGIYMLLSGAMRAFINSENGKEITLYRLFDRDICLFSASCTMKNISFEVFIQAEKETRTLLLPTKIYEHLQSTSLPFANYVNQLLSSHFSDVMWVIEQIVFMSLDERLAFFLSDQAGIEGSETLSITHDQIARHLGTAREVITRMLKYFASEGIVSLSRGVIEIKDRKKMHQIFAK